MGALQVAPAKALPQDLEEWMAGAGDAGVVVFSMADVPLGFGVSARATDDFRKLDPHSIVVLHQSDIGEYLREEAKIGG